MERANQTIRAFIAIDLPEKVKSELKKLMGFLPQEKHIKWVDVKGAHLTLKFLGNIRESQVPEITENLIKIASSYNPFVLALSGCGAFPSLSKIRVIWVGTEGDIEILKEIQREVEEVMEKLGFQKEERPFKPHITLGRAKDAKKSDLLAKVLVEQSSFKSCEFTVKEIVLFKSTLTPQGAIYSPISIIPIGKSLKD